MNKTTYEKAKAYECVSQKVKDFFEGKQKMYSDVKQTLEYLFPELKMSRDEQIRKAIEHQIEKLNNEGWSGIDGIEYADMIVWLEKQGEQKPADSYCKENCKGYKETGKCFADGECKAKKESEQNPAWSDEDEKMLNRVKQEIQIN